MFAKSLPMVYVKSLQKALDLQVTELKVAEHNIKMALGVLNEERGRLQSILHSIGQGVVVTDVQGKILLINEIAAEFMTYPSDEALGLNLLEILGSICGGMTSTPGLGAVASRTDSEIPAISYAAVYPVALILVTLVVQVVIAALRFLGG